MICTANIDPHLLRAYLTEQCHRDRRGVTRERASGLRVAAILPVHLYGLPADSGGDPAPGGRVRRRGHRGCLSGARRRLPPFRRPLGGGGIDGAGGRL
ncbi:MAG: hypothetical protein U0531_12325 [Dehalococcoidia bacterium]